jgi:molecular chaperone DnaJ
MPAGAQPGDAVRARGKGIPHLNHDRRGDLVVVLQVAVPKKLSKKARKLLEELADELGS